MAIFGVIVPLWVSSNSAEQAEKAILSMEKRFEELVGKQLRRPSIDCVYQKKSAEGQLVEESLEGQSIDFLVGSTSLPPIIVRNVGDGSTDEVCVRLYLDLALAPSSGAFMDWWSRLEHCDEPGYKVAYEFLAFTTVLHPQMSCSLGGRWGNFSRGDSVKALLKIYYGEPEPRIVKFSINFK